MQDDRLTPEMAQAMDSWLVYAGTECDDDCCEHGIPVSDDCIDCEIDADNEDEDDEL